MSPNNNSRATTRLAIVGAGRLGHALTTALRRSGGRPPAPGTRPLSSEATPGQAREPLIVIGPLGRGPYGDELEGCDAVLLCVPDAEIANAAATVRPGLLVGHCSGASGLDVLAPHEAFSVHPLMTVTGAGAEFAGASAAIDGSSPRACEFAGRLAGELALRPLRIAPADRAAYHAAASIASNFLITLEAAAERLGASTGLDRAALVPLVRASVENWALLGARQALTGPLARGDTATVRRQRKAVAARTPELLPLFDTLAAATGELAAKAGSDARAAEAETDWTRVERR